MNTGQMMLIIGAITLLSIVTLSVNSMIASKTTTIVQAEAQLTAISIAQSMIDEILTKSYDAATAGGQRIFDSTLCTPAGSLGASAFELSQVPQPEMPDTTVAYKSLTKFNDVDDYHRYRRYYYSNSLGAFGIVDTVYYVQENSPETRSTSQTFFKKIVVTVRHPNLMPPDAERSYNPWSGRYYVQMSDMAVYRRYF